MTENQIESTTPGALIGYRSNGTPIYLLAGGSGEGEGDQGADNGQGDSGDAGDNGGDGTGQDNPGGDSTGTDNGGNASDGAGSGSAGNGGNGDDGASHAIAAIRNDYKSERRRRQEVQKELADVKASLEADKAERARQMDALAIALGVKSGDTPPDPAKLAEELKAARAEAQAEIARRDAEIRSRTIELAVLQSADSHEADGRALLDSRSFMNTLAGLDPAGEDFAAELGDAITKVVVAQPRYKAAKPAAQQPARPQATVPRSGGEHTAPGGNRQWTLDDVEAASASEVVKAQNEGLLADLGYGAPKKRRH